MVQASKRESKGNSFCVARGKARGPPSALPLLFLLSRVFPASCLLVPGLVYDLDWANRTASARLVLVLLCEGRLFFQKSKFPFGNLAKSKSIVLRPSLRARFVLNLQSIIWFVFFWGRFVCICVENTYKSRSCFKKKDFPPEKLRAPISRVEIACCVAQRQEEREREREKERKKEREFSRNERERDRQFCLSLEDCGFQEEERDREREREREIDRAEKALRRERETRERERRRRSKQLVGEPSG